MANFGQFLFKKEFGDSFQKIKVFQQIVRFSMAETLHVDLTLA
jgi:hypothetical protein